MARDTRFVAQHRGGSLTPSQHRSLTRWAADCAEHTLELFTNEHPQDDRPRTAIEIARAWTREGVSVGQARAAAVAAHAAARDAEKPEAVAAARAAGQAVSTPHMADHSLGALYYGVKAVRAAAGAVDAEAAARTEYAWQIDRLSDDVRELVLSALDEGTVLGRWKV